MDFLCGWKLKKDAPDASYWGRHLRQTVQFVKAVKTLSEHPDTFDFIELGPGAGTLMAVRENVDTKGALLLRSLGTAKAARKESDYLMNSLARLYQKGFKMDWSVIMEGPVYLLPSPVMDLTTSPIG